jgi:hypothetical protein
MSKSKTKSKTKATVSKQPSLKDDLKDVEIPFDLFTGLSLVIEEVNKKGFTYIYKTESRNVILTFEAKEISETLSINIEKENLLVRQFTIKEDGGRKLKVIYVVKPSERTFKLV